VQIEFVDCCWVGWKSVEMTGCLGFELRECLFEDGNAAGWGGGGLALFDEGVNSACEILQLGEEVGCDVCVAVSCMCCEFLGITE